MKIRLVKSVLFLLVLVWASAGNAQAQNLSEFDRSRSSVASFYNYSEPGDVTMLVSVWGGVRNPGLYEIARGTELSRLFALSGGPDVQGRNARERKTLYFRLMRDGNVLVEQRMEESLQEIENNVVLQEGDILMVDVEITTRFSWRDVVPVINTIGVLALAFERIRN